MTKGPFGIPQNVQRTVIALLTADTADLRELARIARRDPATFYRGANLRSCDLSKANLHGIDLTGAEKSRAKMPTLRGREPDRGLSKASPSKQADIAALIDEFKPLISAEDAEDLELSYIADLIAEGKRASLDLAASRFIRLSAGFSSPSRSLRRSTWAKLILAYVTPKIIGQLSYGPSSRLLQPWILEDVGISIETAAIFERLEQPRMMLSLPIDRDQIVRTLKYASSVSTEYEVLLEIAELLAKHEHYDSPIWEKALSHATSYAAASVVLQRMKEINIPLDSKAFNIVLESNPPFETGWSLVMDMLAGGVRPNEKTWDNLINLAPDFRTGRQVQRKMYSGAFKPGRTFWFKLLGLSPDYETARVVLSEMIDANVRPNKNVAMKLASLVRGTRDTESLFNSLAQFKLFDQEILSAIIGRLAHAMEAAVLLDCVYSNCRENSCVPRSKVFESAIVHYHKSGQMDQALRIALPFPHLPASIRLLRGRREQIHAEAFFLHEYDSGSEPFHAAAALAYLYWIKGDREKLEHWVEVGKSYSNQHTKRIEGLNRLLSAPPPRTNP